MESSGRGLRGGPNLPLSNRPRKTYGPVGFSRDEPIHDNEPVTLALTLAAIAVTVILVARLSAPIGLPPRSPCWSSGSSRRSCPSSRTSRSTRTSSSSGCCHPCSMPPPSTPRSSTSGPTACRSSASRSGSCSSRPSAWPCSHGGCCQCPFTVAVALGAIVAPPDAVAATAVARGIGLPRRITTILEGESLLNDATALVTLRTAIAAAGLATSHHGFASHGTSRWVRSRATSASRSWVASASGWVVFMLIGLIRKNLTEATSDTALSFAAPFLSYLPAEQLGASGVLAVVTTGLLLAHKSLVLQSAASRLSERVNWASITFLLENTVFLLIGLQLASTVDDVQASEISLGRAVVVGLAVLLAVLLLRPVWMFPFSYLTGRAREGGAYAGQGRQRRRHLVGRHAWGGHPRGRPHPAREHPGAPTLVLIALIVTVGTLALQSRRCPGWRAPSACVARTRVRTRCRRPPSCRPPRGPDCARSTTSPGSIPSSHRSCATTRRSGSTASGSGSAPWPRRRGAAHRDPQAPAHGHARRRARRELVRIRDEDDVDHEILSSVMNQLDAEEAALSWSMAVPPGCATRPCSPPSRCPPAASTSAPCPTAPSPRAPQAARTACARGTPGSTCGSCVSCGNVGCCDSSVGQHAEQALTPRRLTR